MDSLRFVLSYDKKDKDPLVNIVQTLVNAEAENILPVLFTTIEFTLNIDHGNDELEWVLNRIQAEIKPSAYVKIYLIPKSWGEGKVFNSNASDEVQGIIGKGFQEALLAAKVHPKSFRMEYKKKEKPTQKGFKPKS